VAGLATSFGSGAMTNSIADIEKAKAFLVIGSNTTENHPIIGDAVKRAITQKGAKLVVVDPRKIELANYANAFLQIDPGHNIPVLNGMMQVILAEGLHDAAYVAERCEGFEEFAASLSDFTPEKVQEITGVPADALREAARLYATAKPASILYCMGVTQHSQGTDAVKALANLAMLCGNVGVEGGGLNPLRGQNNVQGACDMGGLPNVLTGYQRVDNEEAAAKFEQAWGRKLPRKPGLTVTEATHGALEGTIKALYVMGENPMITDPDVKHVEQALEKLELLVVQDIFLTETAAKAHVVLPACSFAEKDGTFVNTERRVQRVRAAVAPRGESRADWEIFQELAARMGYKMDYGGPSEIFDEIASLTPSYAGMDYGRIERQGLQWPCPTKDHPGTPILHVGQFTRGKGLFAPIAFRGADERADAEYPLLLTTGREHAHYHSGTMTRRCGRINDCFPEGFMEMHPADAQKLGLQTGDAVKVTSRRGEIETKVKVVDRTAPGTVFLSFHYSESPVNVLTNPAMCPTAKIPEYKVCAVRVEKA
jgi:formate dehydrogenase alpha subunit